MKKKILVTFCVFLYAVSVPLLEINDTHVFDTAWTPHSRLHEVWQLITNSGIGIFCLWLVWSRNQITPGIVLSLLVMGGFLFAYVMRDFYGGSMVLSDGTEKTLFGVNIGVIGFGTGCVMLLFALYHDRKTARHGK
jgi:hypothetical protein